MNPVELDVLPCKTSLVLGPELVICGKKCKLLPSHVFWNRETLQKPLGKSKTNESSIGWEVPLLKYQMVAAVPPFFGLGSPLQITRAHTGINEAVEDHHIAPVEDHAGHPKYQEPPTFRQRLLHCKNQ